MRRCRIESLGVSPPRRGAAGWGWGALRHAVAAGKSCLRSSRHRPADVRVLVNSGVHRDGHVCEPAIAAYIQHRLGINTEFQGRRTLSFDLLNGGCGMLNAAQVLWALMQGGDVPVGMAVASEANGDRRPDPASAIAASGAALLLDISPRRDVGFGSFAFRTDDTAADLYTSVVDLTVRRGRLLLRRRAELEQAYLAMVGAAVDEALAKEGLSREQIDRVVPAQISAGFLSRLPAASGFPRERVADLTGQLPDTISTSVFLALQRSLAARPPARGEKALLIACGAGVTVAAATYHF
ncbi:MAG TPA: 3-oxoacyl-[acyl-carrier-protein] synthase III C-terminal domain-containing protein [Candidatus Edwardsbacteria bacterium]|nr:3-oxoacyl-[acyl-carrier-protein] synthase III C-terminal domain-containing protein [Candidatus Edwardsbacteria bacterium]